MADKNYCNGILIKEVGNYGNLKVSIKIEEFYGFIKSIGNNGWANIEIAKNKQPTDKGYTHHCYENTFKPDPNYRSQHNGIDPHQKVEPMPEPEEGDSEILPF